MSRVLLHTWSRIIMFRLFASIVLFLLLVYYMRGRGYLNYIIKGPLKNSTFLETVHTWTTGESILAKINQRAQKFANDTSLVPPLINYSQVFLISEKYNLATCQIEKVMSTFRRGLFCYLNRQVQFEKEGRSISTEQWSNTLCKDGKDAKKSLHDALASLGKYPVIFSIIRHPFDRFLSGYVNKCIDEKYAFEERCFGCEQNLVCFIKNLKMQLFIYSGSIRNLTDAENYYVRHFAPTTWYCNLRESANRINFVKYHQNNTVQLADDINGVLKKAGIHQNQRAYIKRELIKQLPVHATAHSKDRSKVERKLLSDLQLYTLFMEIYYYDFIAFNFPFPKIG